MPISKKRRASQQVFDKHQPGVNESSSATEASAAVPGSSSVVASLPTATGSAGALSSSPRQPSYLKRVVERQPAATTAAAGSPCCRRQLWKTRRPRQPRAWIGATANHYSPASPQQKLVSRATSNALKCRRRLTCTFALAAPTASDMVGGVARLGDAQRASDCSTTAHVTPACETSSIRASALRRCELPRRAALAFRAGGRRALGCRRPAFTSHVPSEVAAEKARPVEAFAASAPRGWQDECSESFQEWPVAHRHVQTTLHTLSGPLTSCTGVPMIIFLAGATHQYKRPNR